MMEGISIVICCHNGAARLPATLEHLKRQQAPNVPWEVVLIDNASTDKTGETARRCWQDGPAPVRIIEEPRLGIRFARQRGLAEASYPVIGFVDDDNWLMPDWVARAVEVMSSEHDLGAAGSIREAVCEIPPPAWFSRFHGSYAILTDGELDHRTLYPPFLPTAGLCVRKAAWSNLIGRGFQPQVPSRIGKNLHGGEDTELTVAIRLSGWKLRVDRGLRLQHYIPAGRLHWSYLRRMLRASGASDVWLDAYSDHSLSMEPGPRRWLSESWWYQLARTQLELGRRPCSVLATLTSPAEGRYDVIEVERLYGRTIGLIQSRARYRTLRRSIREASWRQAAAGGALHS